MPNSDVTADQAAQAFVHDLKAQVYDGTISAVRAEVRTELASGQGEEPGAWFASLDARGQQQVDELIQRSVDLALFSCLCFLDGASGAIRIPNPTSDDSFGECALYLEVFSTIDTLTTDEAPVKTRIDGGARSESLHDLYVRAVEPDL